MRRIAAEPRANWQQKVEAAGLIWHSGDQVYWNEAAFYEFTAKEVDALEAATNELEKMTLAAAQHIVDNKLYARMGISEIAVPLIGRYGIQAIGFGFGGPVDRQAGRIVKSRS